MRPLPPRTTRFDCFYVYPTVSTQKRANADLTVQQSEIDVACASLLAAWNQFLSHDAGNRPFVLIGHSQGSAILVHLVATQIDHDPSLLRRLVVAILPGGNLQVPAAQTARLGQQVGRVNPGAQESLGPDWGYHLEDINLALGDLVPDVAGEENAWTAAHR